MAFCFSIIVPYFPLMKFDSKAIAATFFEEVSSVEKGSVTLLNSSVNAALIIKIGNKLWKTNKETQR